MKLKLHDVSMNRENHQLQTLLNRADHYRQRFLIFPSLFVHLSPNTRFSKYPYSLNPANHLISPRNLPAKISNNKQKKAPQRSSDLLSQALPAGHLSIASDRKLAARHHRELISRHPNRACSLGKGKGAARMVHPTHLITRELGIW